MENKTTFIAIILIVTVVICAFIACAFYMIFKDYGYITVDGIVVEIKISEGDERAFYSPVVEFVYKGKTYVASSSVSSSSIDYNIGDKISIRVNPDNPQQISISTERNIGYAIIIFIAFICLMLLNFRVIVPKLKAKYREYHWGGIFLSFAFIIFPLLIYTVTYLFSGQNSLNAFINNEPYLTIFLAFSALGTIGLSTR